MYPCVHTRGNGNVADRLSTAWYSRGKCLSAGGICSEVCEKDLESRPCGSLGDGSMSSSTVRFHVPISCTQVLGRHILVHAGTLRCFQIFGYAIYLLGSKPMTSFENKLLIMFDCLVRDPKRSSFAPAFRPTARSALGAAHHDGRGKVNLSFHQTSPQIDQSYTKGFWNSTSTCNITITAEDGLN